MAKVASLPSGAAMSSIRLTPACDSKLVSCARKSGLPCEAKVMNSVAMVRGFFIMKATAKVGVRRYKADGTDRTRRPEP